MEEQVVNLYDLNVLNKETLHALMAPFVDTDIDHGGCCDLKAKDGKSADDIICFIMEPEKYQIAVDNFPNDPDYPEFNSALSNLWYEITRREWQFW